jgi:hypothetical protein
MIEIGGTKRNGAASRRLLVEEECHRNIAFTLYRRSIAPVNYQPDQSR